MAKPRTRVQVLKAARELITPRDAWTKGTMRRWVRFFDDGLIEEKAVGWCAAGAINEIDGPAANGAYRALAQTLVDEFQQSKAFADPIPTITHFNDNSSHKEVLKAFDKTIERLGG